MTAGDAVGGVRMPVPPGYVAHPDGVAEIDVTDYLCPDSGQWTACPGPCPDGTPHSETRVRRTFSRRYRLERVDSPPTAPVAAVPVHQQEEK